MSSSVQTRHQCTVWAVTTLSLNGASTSLEQRSEHPFGVLDNKHVTGLEPAQSTGIIRVVAKMPSNAGLAAAALRLPYTACIECVIHGVCVCVCVCVIGDRVCSGWWCLQPG